MICPVCGIEMIAVERSGIELDSCLSCRGLWFDIGELELFGEMSGADVTTLGLGAREGRPGRRRCPRCKRRLEEIAHGGVRIDRCPAGDGFWFDRGELGSLVDHAPSVTGGLGTISAFLGEVFSARADRGEEA